MKTFTIEGILASAKFFSRAEGANEAFEIDLRSIESEKQNLPPDEITTTDIFSVCTAFSNVVAANCVTKVVDAVIAKYKELGHKVTEVQ